MTNDRDPSDRHVVFSQPRRALGVALLVAAAPVAAVVAFAAGPFATTASAGTPSAVARAAALSGDPDPCHVATSPNVATLTSGVSASAFNSLKLPLCAGD